MPSGALISRLFSDLRTTTLTTCVFNRPSARPEGVGKVIPGGARRAVEEYWAREAGLLGLPEVKLIKGDDLLSVKAFSTRTALQGSHKEVRIHVLTGGSILPYLFTPRGQIIG